MSDWQDVPERSGPPSEVEYPNAPPRFSLREVALWLVGVSVLLAVVNRWPLQGVSLAFYSTLAFTAWRIYGRLPFFLSLFVSLLIATVTALVLFLLSDYR